MHDERSEPVMRDTEGGSQDSGGSGATVGESLRSLEVEIGSADGHEEGDRHPGAERLGTHEMQPAGARDRGVDRERRTEQGGVVDEDLEGAQTADQQGHDVEGTEAAAGAFIGQVEAAATGVQDRDQGAVGEQLEGGDAPVNSIDPTFLEALPADLRAEILASRQARAARPPNPVPPPGEEIDPEFLAALPPDIQAEVLAQQRAQRAVIAAIEAQPVDMDSASIIATFPVELREEVGMMLSSWSTEKCLCFHTLIHSCLFCQH
jgi:E3 ubiquitin-protein ligase HUWE1